VGKTTIIATIGLLNVTKNLS